MISKKQNDGKKKQSDVINDFQIVVVSHVHDFGNGRIGFNATFDGLVTIYNMTYIEGNKNGKEYAFVSMPQEKGKDGNYYNRAWLHITDDLLSSIQSQLEKALG